MVRFLLIWECIHTTITCLPQNRDRIQSLMNRLSQKPEEVNSTNMWITIVRYSALKSRREFAIREKHGVYTGPLEYKVPQLFPLSRHPSRYYQTTLI